MKIFLKSVCLFLFILFFFQYIINVKYKFVKTQPFHGDFIYNPYSAINRSKWKLANFHVHTREWMGLSNGWKNNVDQVKSLYTSLGYDIINISDYQKINFDFTSVYSLPEYEHGYLFPKNHQLVLNAQHVNWIDYLFPETIDNKQYIINQLRDNNDLVVINHPRLNNAYTADDMKSISGYDCMEVLNQNCFSIAYYDSALSSGHVVYILADDDCHDITNIYNVGRCATYVDSPLIKDSILTALKSGQSFGADIYMHDNEINETKKEIIKSLPKIVSVNILNDSLTIILNAHVKNFTFIGQGGKIKSVVRNNNMATYPIQKNDTYVRTQILCEDNTVYYLNPVFRYDGKNIPVYLNPVDNFKTWSFRVFGVLAVILIYLFMKKWKNPFARYSIAAVRSILLRIPLFQ